MKRLAIAVLVVLSLGAGAGCGKKGELRAPEFAAPKPITNLEGRNLPNGVDLTWSRPSEYIDGKEIKDLASFVIFRKEISPSCLDCPVPYRQLTTVFVEDREKFVKQKKYQYRDQDVASKAIYRYRVASQLTDGALSEPSNEIEIKR